MAVFTRVSPSAEETDFEVGQNLHFFTVDYINSAAASTGPNGVMAAVYRTIQKTSTLVCAGPLCDSNTQQTFAVEATGGNGSVVTATLQTAVRALGTVDSVDLSSATVTSTKLAILTAAVV